MIRGAALDGRPEFGPDMGDQVDPRGLLQRRRPTHAGF